MNKDYVKHLIECKCILPQFKNSNPPIFHKFLVFSEIDMNDGNIISSYVQCNNCGVIHRVMEIGRSTVLKKENMNSLLSIDEIKSSLPSRLVLILEQNDCVLAIWQEAQFIIQNGLWGRGFTLTQEREGDLIMGKYIVILGETIYDIKSFERNEGMI
jgi:hypothetical protein